MLKAINKTTGKIVDSIQIYKDGSYLNPKNDYWYAPENEILNLDSLIKNKEIVSNEDIEVVYVSESRDANDIARRPHFRIKDKNKKNIITKQSSELHNRLVNWLFDYIQKDGANIDFAYSTFFINKKNNIEKINIKEFEIDYSSYETTIIPELGKNIRADVFIHFKKKHELFGNGIVFEIQLSKQKDIVYTERTLDRALNGYSVCWLGKNNFEDIKDSLILKNNTVFVQTHSSIITNQSLLKIKNLKQEIEVLCRTLDNKRDEILLKINKENETLQTIKNNICEKIEYVSKTVHNSETNMIKTKDTISNFYKDLTQNVFQDSIEKMKNFVNLYLKNNDDISKIISERVEKEIIEKFIETFNNIIISKKLEIDNYLFNANLKLDKKLESQILLLQENNKKINNINNSEIQQKYKEIQKELQNKIEEIKNMKILKVMCPHCREGYLELNFFNSGKPFVSCNKKNCDYTKSCGDINW